VCIVTREREKDNHRTFLQIRAHEADEETMAKIRHDHPEPVLFKIEYFAARENAKKTKKEEAAETEVGPSTIDLSSGSSSELDSDFWNNLNSSDDDDWE
jgi:hypothetical protein